jgi:signal transduction histidine kinase/ActR/RegA family two-component response regulator
VHSTPLVTRFGKAVGVVSLYFRTPHCASERQTRVIELCARQAVDFIENARLYEQLREADRRKDEFLATLAHELRNPLAPISGSLQILRLTDDLSPAVEHVRSIMEEQVNHLVRLVDDLLEVSRITRGKIELRKKSVDLVAVIASAVEISRPLIEAAGHQLAITLSPEPMALEADAVRLSQVIANLLNNAAKYTDKGGQIWLSAQRQGGEAVVSVRDTGCGISADMLPRIFDMFAQVDRTLERAQGGLGIGLSLAKNLVEMHGGRIEAHSAGPGRGSEFIVWLPLVHHGPRSTLAASAPENGKRHLPARRILVVDDTRSAAYVLGKLLEKLGQQVCTAHDAISALEHARIERPDMVISDIAMPDMNGYELARLLRQEAGMTAVVLVALTGYGQSSDKQRAKEAGFDYHLVKPVSLESLEEMLASLPASPDALVRNNAGQNGGN